MNVEVKTNGSEATLTLPMRFDHSMLSDFRSAFTGLLGDDQVEKIVVDCSRLTFIDSLGLGLLLVLREKASERNIKVALAGAIDRIRKILWIANFHSLFEIA